MNGKSSENETNSVRERSSPTRPDADPDFIVGVGASAGGLESLEKFFDNMPAVSGMAFVIIQHLSPDFKSMMDELLARHTDITIQRAEDGMAVLANNIYLLPPTKEMTIVEGCLRLTDKDPSQGLALPIDIFFSSLAQDCGDRSVAIVLSGTGSDGSRGIADVKRVGGLVLCENDRTAKFNGMPISAQETGAVDVVLTAEELPLALMKYVDSPMKWRLKNGPPPIDAPPLVGVEAVFDLLRREYDIDFSHYKPSTVSRRIERRLSLVHAGNLDEYVERLRDDSEELNALYRDLLIGVTKFFRDSGAFEVLERETIPDVLERVPKNQEIRIWVAGCATGEEAYSLAILFYEALERAGRPINLKVFATDVHKVSLEHAGVGLFDDDRVATVSPERLRRFFQKRQSGYQVSQDLRQLIVFAQHNVIKDAPFTNLDLISCRNLLIYFQPQAQTKALSLFHFGLKKDGTLLLGSSETPGTLIDEFDTLDGRAKIYRKRRDVRLPADMRLPLSRSTHGLSGSLPLTTRSETTPSDDSMLSVYDNLLDRYMPPSLLVNERRQLLESFGGAEKLLRIKGRRLSADLMDLLETEARTTIAGALNRVIRHGQPLTFSGVWLNDGENEQQYRLAIEPVDGATNGSGNYLILFEPTSPARATPTNDRQEFNADEMSRDQVTHLEDELRYTKENLQATVEELETSNEEMQATNEELVASNEELQSTNEELHSVNEELYTVNGEHQKKITELAELNQDMVHLLDSTDVAIVYLDENLCIRKFTPKVAEIFDLVDQDVGRRIGTFSHRIRHDDLLERLQGVLDTGERYEAEVRDHDDKCFLLRILPYRVSDRIAGVVLSLIDINVLHDARSRISRLSSIVESSSSAIIGTNVDGVIESWNPAAGRLYEYSEEEAIGKNISMLVPDSHKEESARSIETIRREDEHVVIPETERITKSGKRITISLSRSSIKDQDGNIIGVSSISRDIARLKQVERAKADTEARLRLLLDSTAEAIYGVDRNGLCTFVNPACTRLLGYTSEELLGQKLHELIHHKQVDGSPLSPEERTTFQVFSDGMPVHRPEDVFWRKDGSYFYAEVWSHPMYEDDNLVGAVVTFLDVTHRKEAVENLRNEARRREQFLAMLSHELRNPLSAIRTATRLQNASEIDEATVAESRKVIDRQTRQMTRLLDDLLDVSRITEDKIGLNIEPVDLRSTVESALQSVQPLADDCQIGIKTELPDNPVIVLADATRIEQIQSNLLSNAIKYSYPGATVRLSLEVAGDEALLQVTDGGAGIAPQMLDQIFDMFVQVEDTIDRAHGGMGVGLTLVKRLVEMHDGTITAHSEGIDKGSEFIVRLPLSNDRSVTVKELCESASNGATVESALVIEDQDDNRKMLTSLLRLEGITVHAAASGVEGLALARSKQPDVAIVDIGLPEMNGYEVAEAIRAELGDEMFLIALTGYGQPRDIKNAKNAGFDHHLVKPLEPDLLVSALQRGRTSADV